MNKSTHLQTFDLESRINPLSLSLWNRILEGANDACKRRAHCLSSWTNWKLFSQIKSDNAGETKRDNRLAGCFGRLCRAAGRIHPDNPYLSSISSASSIQTLTDHLPRGHTSNLSRDIRNELKSLARLSGCGISAGQSSWNLMNLCKKKNRMNMYFFDVRFNSLFWGARRWFEEII